MVAPNLMLHSGGFEATRDQVYGVQAPAPDGRWHPISHAQMLEMVERQLPQYGIDVAGDVRYALSGKDNARMFAVMPVERRGMIPNNEWRFVMGLRNSIDKSFPAGMVIGTEVFVCDNLAFNGQVKGEMKGDREIRRRHTKNILQDLPRLVGNMLSGYNALADRVVKEIDVLHEIPMTPAARAELLVNTVRHRLIGPHRLMDVIGYIDNPPEGQDMETAWGVYNAFTGALRGRSADTVLRESTRLAMLFSDIAAKREIQWPEIEADDATEAATGLVA